MARDRTELKAKERRTKQGIFHLINEVKKGIGTVIQGENMEKVKKCF